MGFIARFWPQGSDLGLEVGGGAQRRRRRKRNLARSAGPEGPNDFSFDLGYMVGGMMEEEKKKIFGMVSRPRRTR